MLSEFAAVERFGYYIRDHQIVFATIVQSDTVNDGKPTVTPHGARPATQQEIQLYELISPFNEREVLTELVNHLHEYSLALEAEGNTDQFEIVNRLEHIAREAGISTMLAPPY